jgi:hypothetical protein
MIIVAKWRVLSDEIFGQLNGLEKIEILFLNKTY